MRAPLRRTVVSEPGSLHQEWDLMYRRGLSVRQIAELCGAVRGTVDRHLRSQKLRDPSLGADHLANRPQPKARPLGSTGSRTWKPFELSASNEAFT